MYEILTRRDKMFNVVNCILMALLSLVILYPLYFILIGSISDPQLIATGKVILWPKGINVDGYLAVFKDARVLSGYKNSFLYAIVGSLITLGVTLCAAFPLANKEFKGRNAIMVYFTITMFFSGGMIPTYLVIQKLGLINTIWSLVLPGAATTYNILIARTYISTSIPTELQEAASIDGCGHTIYFLRILLPLCAPIMAVLVLFSAVGHWNSYMAPLLYIRDESKYPLQIILRSILIQNSASDAMMMDSDSYMEMAKIAEKVKYALIIVASVPVLCLYPFLQRYLIKGMMVGSIKG